jgi:hypothetical protein
MDMLDYCYREKFTHIHLGSCGTVGLTGLFIARLLKLPTTTTYQPSLLDEVRSLTGDEFMEELAWKYSAWFYNQVDRVFVSSTGIERRLRLHGVQPSRLHRVPPGTDKTVAAESAAQRWNFLGALILNPAGPPPRCNPPRARKRPVTQPPRSLASPKRFPAFLKRFEGQRPAVRPSCKSECETLSHSRFTRI